MSKTEALRPIIYGILCIVLLLTVIIALASPAWWTNGQGFEASANIWRSCNTTTANDETVCQDLDKTYNTCIASLSKLVRAFGVMALLPLILGGFAAASDFMRMLHRLPELVKRAPKNADKIVLVTLALIPFFLTLACWILLTALMSANCAGSKISDKGTIKWGPSMPLFIVASVLCAAAATIAMVIPRPPDINLGDSSTSAPGTEGGTSSRHTRDDRNDPL